MGEVVYLKDRKSSTQKLLDDLEKARREMAAVEAQLDARLKQLNKRRITLRHVLTVIGLSLLIAAFVVWRIYAA